MTNQTWASEQATYGTEGDAEVAAILKRHRAQPERASVARTVTDTASVELMALAVTRLTDILGVLRDLRDGQPE